MGSRAVLRPVVYKSICPTDLRTVLLGNERRWCYGIHGSLTIITVKVYSYGHPGSPFSTKSPTLNPIQLPGDRLDGICWHVRPPTRVNLRLHHWSVSTYKSSNNLNTVGQKELTEGRINEWSWWKVWVLCCLSTGAISIKYSVLLAVRHTQTVPSLNPTISHDDCICSFILI